MRPGKPRPRDLDRPRPSPPLEPPRLAARRTHEAPRATLRRLGEHEQIVALDRPVLHIGRAHERCGLVLTDPDIAAQHCCLRLHRDRWWLLDRGAPAGTYLNNHRCREPRELRDGDRISLGLCLLEFRCTAAAALPAALAHLSPVELELPPPSPCPPPPPPRPRSPGAARTVVLAALAAFAVTLPVAANFTPTRLAPPASATLDPQPAPSDSPSLDPRPAPPDPLSHQPAPSDSTPINAQPVPSDSHPRPSAASDGAAARPPEFLAEPPAFELPGDALARGRPDAGRLERGLTLPPSPDYLIRCPAHAHASSSTAHELMQALAALRNHGAYRGELVVGDLSQAGGGRYGPHRSHQSGRDVDLWLPISGGRYRRGCVRCGTDRCRPDPLEVDWLATWRLVQALAARGSVQDIFLARELHPHLRRAARELGVPEAELEPMLPHAGSRRPTLVKHAAGHTHHLHVRFRCPPDDPACVPSP